MDCLNLSFLCVALKWLNSLLKALFKILLVVTFYWGNFFLILETVTLIEKRTNIKLLSGSPFELVNYMRFFKLLSIALQIPPSRNETVFCSLIETHVNMLLTLF